MKKVELIQKLQQRSLMQAKTKNEGPIILFFIDYLLQLNIEHDEKYDFWHIDHYLPQIVADAYELLRTSEREWVVKHRRNYEKAVVRTVPNLLEIGVADDLQRALETQTLGYLFAELIGEEWIKNSFETYLDAQFYVLRGVFDKFLRKVYREGLYDLIQNTVNAGMSGRFGKTDLRTFVTGGRIMLTFARGQDKDEINVSFVAEDNDSNAYSAGTQSIHAMLPECLAMIEEVIQLWPGEKEAQARAFQVSNVTVSNVTLMLSPI